MTHDPAAHPQRTVFLSEQRWFAGKGRDFAVTDVEVLAQLEDGLAHRRTRSFDAFGRAGAGGAARRVAPRSRASAVSSHRTAASTRNSSASTTRARATSSSGASALTDV